MPLVPVSSLDDPRIAPYRAIRGRDPVEAGVFIVESEMLALRLLGSRFETVSLFCAQRWAARLAEQAPPEVPIYVVSEERMNEVLGFNFHRGVMACGRRPLPGDLSIDRLLPARTLIVCPHITQNENLGLILRAAAGLGADGLLLSDRGADPFSRQATRVSTGASFMFPIAVSSDILADLRRLKEREGMRLVATLLSPDAVELHTFDRPERVALLVGNEFEGLPPDIIALCDHRVTIPMHRGIDSLNVAMATGIVLHHVINGRP
jgi:tRNA G18 (ribose-2'-O)-methylase SpoU